MGSLRVVVQVLEPFALLGGKGPVTIGQARVQFLSGPSQHRTSASILTRCPRRHGDGYVA